MIAIVLGYLNEDIQAYANNFILILIVILIALIISNLSERILYRSRLALRILSETTIHAIVRGIRYVLLLSVLLAIVKILGYDITYLVTGLGIAGIIIGFAAKDPIANVISGFLLLADKSFELGDEIEVEGLYGTVEDITLRSTRIRTVDHKLVYIPNAELIAKNIVNYTIGDRRIRLKIPLGISYESDIDLAKKIMVEAAKETEGTLLNPEPEVLLKNFGDFSVDLELRAWIRDAKERFKLDSEIRWKIKTKFLENGIEIPYPRRYLILDKKSMGDLIEKEKSREFKQRNR